MLAQVSLEFTLFVSILLILLLTTIFYNSELYIQMDSTKTFIDAQSLSDQIASEINTGLIAGDGYSRVFFLSKEVDSFNYTVVVNNYLVALQLPDFTAQSLIFTKAINGTFVQGQNSIKNVNGNIYVNQ